MATKASPNRTQGTSATAGTVGSISSTPTEAERIRRSRDIRNRTVVLRLDPTGKPYSRYDVALGLSETETFSNGFGEIECIGPLSRNAEWYITVASMETKLKLLSETVTVNGKLGTFAPAGVTEFKARIHWLPQRIDSQSIAESLKAYNLDVVQITIDKSMPDSAIPVRTVIIKADSIDKIPHLIKVRDIAHGPVFEALVTVPRRPPLCLRCRQIGHIRSQCVAPFCPKCKNIGHREPECPAQKGSYASVAGGNVPQPTDGDADMDEVSTDNANADKGKSEDHQQFPQKVNPK